VPFVVKKVERDLLWRSKIIGAEGSEEYFPLGTEE